MARIKYKQIVQNENRQKDILEGYGIQNKDKLIYKEKKMTTEIVLKDKDIYLKRTDDEKKIILHFLEKEKTEGILKIENIEIPLQINTEKIIQEKGFLKIIYEVKNQKIKIEKIDFEFYYEVIK